MRSASSFSRNNAGVAPWKIWLPVLIFFVLLDLGFDTFFWKIPKVSPDDADFGYQFAIDEHRLEQPPPAGTRRVIAFGSSVSGSFDARQVEGLVEAARPRPPIEVERLMLPGIHQEDYEMLFASGEIPPPDVAVILFNLVDFLYPTTDREVNPTLRYILPPFQVLERYHSSLSFSDELDLALSGVSNLYRYRKLIRSCVQDNFRALRRWFGFGKPAANFGIYPDGYTERRFGLTLDGNSTKLEYYIDPDWLAQRGAVHLEFRAGSRLVAGREETDPGWKTIELTLPWSPARLEVTADSVWNLRAARRGDDLRLLGVRLKEVPAEVDPNARRPFRYRLSEPGDIEPFLRLDGKRGPDFDRAWQELLESDTRFAKRFRLYRDAKLALKDKPFEATADYKAIAALVDRFHAAGTQVVLINTPESPKILEQYETGPYYSGYREFFDHLARNTPGVKFYDLSAVMPAEDFNDWHHLNYIGGIKLGRVYANTVIAALDQAMKSRDGSRATAASSGGAVSR